MFRDLTRKNQQLSKEECLRILQEETRGVLSVLGDGGYPYGMPMNPWYNVEDGCLYFHCGKHGHRLDALRRCNKVSFCTYDRGYRVEGDWAWRVKSVIAFGTMDILDDPELIAQIMRKLSDKFTDDTAYVEREIRESTRNTLLLRLNVEHLCGKLVTEN